ncbi:hypothetical protein MetfoDRAFT_1972, partial [Methanotorris formicicus Mc-S-70]
SLYSNMLAKVLYGNIALTLSVILNDVDIKVRKLGDE